MWTADHWKDYEVIDTSCGEKLERWGKYTLLAYAAVRGGGEFNDKSVGYIEEVAEKLLAKEPTEEALREKYHH